MILIDTVAVAVAPLTGRKEALLPLAGGAAEAGATVAMRRTSGPSMKHVIS